MGPLSAADSDGSGSLDDASFSSGDDSLGAVVLSSDTVPLSDSEHWPAPQPKLVASAASGLNAWQRHQTRTDAARRWLWHTTARARAAATERQAAHAWLLGGGRFTDGRGGAAGRVIAY